MTLAYEQLPNDLESLKQLVLELQSGMQALEQQLQSLLRHRYGQRSEKQRPEKQRPVETANTSGLRSTSTSSTAHGRQRLPDDLPREEVKHSLSDANRVCPDCGQLRTALGETISEQLDYIPGRLCVRRHVRTKYACRPCQGQVIIADLPAQPIDKGLPTAGLLAHVVVSKYDDHLPLYRQEQQFSRQGVAIARSTLADWIYACGQRLAPLVEAMKEDALKAPKLHTDDTPVPVQAKGKTKQGRLWVYVSDSQGHPVMALYDYSPSRAGIYPQRYLATYQGYIQADAFAGYDELYKDPGRIEVGCWAHSRRKFEEIVKQSHVPGRAHQAMTYIGTLYDIERALKEVSKALRYEQRLERSKPVLDEFKDWLDRQTVLPKSALGKAIHYVLNHWQALTHYLLDGGLAIDNNAAERAIRPLAVGRKNWLFAGSDQAGIHAAVLYSLIQTCKLNGVNTFYYLKDVLTRLPTTKMKDIASLLPYRWPLHHQVDAKAA